MSDVTGTVGADVQQAQFRAFTPPTEAGHRYNVQLTVVGATASKLVTAIQDFTAVLDAGGWTPAYGFAGPHGQGAGQHAQAGPMAATGASIEGEPGYTDVEWITVNVPKDGKIRVEGWRDGRDYAEENIVRTPDKMAPLLATIGLDTAPAEHKPLPVRIHWTRGRERTDKAGAPTGKYFHDATRLELLPPA